MEKTGVLNDQIFKKAFFRFRTANWYLLSVLWLTINFPGKKIAAPQSQQDKVQGSLLPARKFIKDPYPSHENFFVIVSTSNVG